MPCITSSHNLDDGTVHMVDFPYVTSTVNETNTSAVAKTINVHFQSGSGTTAVTVPGDAGKQTIDAGCDVIAGFHYIQLTQAGQVTIDIKCTKLYISNLSSTDNLRYQVAAELTNIPAHRMPHLTGSGITDLGGATSP